MVTLRGWKSSPKQRLLNFCVKVLGSYPDPSFVASGPPHDPVFTSTFSWPGGQLCGVGQGKTKREAERSCAIDFLVNLEKLLGLDLDDGWKCHELLSSVKNEHQQQQSSQQTQVSGILHGMSSKAERARRLLSFFCREEGIAEPKFFEWTTGPQHELVHHFSIDLAGTGPSQLGEGKTKAEAQNQALRAAETWITKSRPQMASTFRDLLFNPTLMDSGHSAIISITLPDLDRLRLPFVLSYCSSCPLPQHFPSSFAGSRWKMPPPAPPTSLRSGSRVSTHPIAGQLMNALDSHQVALVTGATGSGKSTQIPQLLLEELRARGHVTGNIVVIEPRRLAATSLARRVAEERGEEIGESVGYAVRFEQVLPKHSGITFMTSGVFLKVVQGDPQLGEYSHIIVDEVHERDLVTDNLLTILRDCLPQRPDLRLILMSASLQVDNFRDSFGPQTPVISIADAPYPIQDYFLEDLEKILPAGMADTSIFSRIEALIATIHQGANAGGILCFLPGWEDISTMRQRLLESTKIDPASITLVAVHSQMTAGEQQRSLLPPSPNTRKIVLATNIAETSITIP